MKQEDKDLLVKELCTRQAYNVQVEYNGKVHSVLGISYGRLVLCEPFMSYAIDECPLVDEVKPYLFPFSSMTNEQYKIYHELICGMFSTNVLINYEALTDFFNKNHFDYRGLIRKGLAIDCSNLNIY